ncbi:MAG: beta-ketoacyl synthase chain length factor [Methylococcales bacterium]
MLSILGMGVCCPNAKLLDLHSIQGRDVDKSLLPSGIRRRTSSNTRMAVTAAYDACQHSGIDAATLPSVFASLGGEMQVTDSLCMVLPDQNAPLSPTQFHNSVHNTTAGYWSIITGSHQPITAIAAEFDTFAMGLLEAWCQLQFYDGPLLVVCYDELWPQYLCPPIGKQAFACALVLQRDDVIGESVLGKISQPHQQSGAEKQVDEPLLTFMRAAPAAVAVPLLRAIQKGISKDMILLSIEGYDWVVDLEV